MRRERLLFIRGTFVSDIIDELIPLNSWPELTKLDVDLSNFSLSAISTLLKGSPSLSVFNYNSGSRSAPELIATLLSVIAICCPLITDFHFGNLNNHEPTTLAQFQHAFSSCPSAESVQLFQHCTRIRIGETIDDSAIHFLLSKLRAAPLRSLDICSNRTQTKFRLCLYRVLPFLEELNPFEVDFKEQHLRNRTLPYSKISFPFFLSDDQVNIRVSSVPSILRWMIEECRVVRLSSMYCIKL